MYSMKMLATTFTRGRKGLVYFILAESAKVALTKWV